jgi:hypothetical protein
MTIIDANELLFAGEDGETITVVVKSANTTHAVNAVLDGQTAVMTPTGSQSGTLSFTLNMAVKDPSHLALLFHFFNTMGGGIYKVIIKGDKGGPPFGMLVPQPLSQATARMYAFDVI